MFGGNSNAYKNHSCMYRVQAEKLRSYKGQKDSSGSYGNKEILQILQEAHNA